MPWGLFPRDLRKDLIPEFPISVSEEQCLYQIYIDELYGGLQKPNEDEKKK